MNSFCNSFHRPSDGFWKTRSTAIISIESDDTPDISNHNLRPCSCRTSATWFSVGKYMQYNQPLIEKSLFVCDTNSAKLTFIQKRRNNITLFDDLCFGVCDKIIIFIVIDASGLA